MSPKLTSISLNSKRVYPAKYVLSNENIPAIICKSLDWRVNVIVTVYTHSLSELNSVVFLFIRLSNMTFIGGFHQSRNEGQFNLTGYMVHNDNYTMTIKDSQILFSFVLSGRSEKSEDIQ